MKKLTFFIAIFISWAIFVANGDVTSQVFMGSGESLPESEFVDSLPGVLVIRMDDGFKESMDSIDVLTGVTTAPYTGLPWYGTHYIMTGFLRYYDAISGEDTSATVYATPRGTTSRFSVADLAEFQRRGWEIAIHDRYKYGVGDDGSTHDIWGNDRFVDADTTKWAYQNDLELSQQDLAILGFPPAKTFSYPYHNSRPWIYQYLKDIGIKYATVSRNLTSGKTAGKDGLNSSTLLSLAKSSLSDQASRFAMPMVHGDLPHPYTIAYNGGKGEDLERNKANLISVMETGGCMIYHLHYPSEVPGGGAEYGTVSEFLIFADSLRAAYPGKLVSKTMYDAGEWFYTKRPSPTCNLLDPTFADYDSGFSYDDDHLNKIYQANSKYAKGYGDGAYGSNSLMGTIKRGPVREGDVASFEQNNVVWCIPNVGKPGQRYKFDVLVQYATGCVPVAGDSIGAVIKVFNDVFPRQWGETHWVTRLSGGYSPSSAGIKGDNYVGPSRGNSHWDDNAQGVIPGSDVVTTATEANGEWQAYRLDVPAGDGDLLLIMFWIDHGLCGSGVRLSQPSLTVYDAN